MACSETDVSVFFPHRALFLSTYDALGMYALFFQLDLIGIHNVLNPGLFSRGMASRSLQQVALFPPRSVPPGCGKK